MNKKLQVVDIVVNKVLEDMKKHNKPIWHRFIDLNHFNRWTGKRYKGLNVLLLMLGGGSGEYLTINQLDAYNKKNKTEYLIKKGSKALMVTFQKKVERNAFDHEIEEMENGSNRFKVYEKDGEYKRSYFNIRYYNVFDIVDIVDKDGNPMPPFSERVLEEVTEGEQELPKQLESTDADDLMKEYCRREIILFVNEKCTPHYNPTMDIIKVPEKETFDKEVNYYSTCFHEAVHSTGSEKRINRPSLKEYHRAMSVRGTEELIAEIGANMLLVESGYNIEEIDIDTTVDYISSWAMWIEDNKDSFIYACNAAHKAVDFFLGFESEKNNYDEVIGVGEIEIEMDIENEELKAETLTNTDSLNGTSQISTDPLEGVTLVGEQNQCSLTEQEPLEVQNNDTKHETLNDEELLKEKELLEHFSKGGSIVFIVNDALAMVDSKEHISSSMRYCKQKDIKYVMTPVLSTWEGTADARAVISSLKPNYNYVIYVNFMEGEQVKHSRNLFGSQTELLHKLNSIAGQASLTDCRIIVTKMLAY